jgi:hypothetical protein
MELFFQRRAVGCLPHLNLKRRKTQIDQIGWSPSLDPNHYPIVGDKVEVHLVLAVPF